MFLLLLLLQLLKIFNYEENYFYKGGYANIKCIFKKNLVFVFLWRPATTEEYVFNVEPQSKCVS